MPDPMLALLRADARAAEIRREAMPLAPVDLPPSVLRGAPTHTGAHLLKALDEQGWTLTPKTGSGDVTIALSPKAAAFLLGTVRHLNQKKILPEDNVMALETSAWLEEIEAHCAAALEAGEPDGA